MAHYTNQYRIASLMQGWAQENKAGLLRKMQAKGINQGGFLGTLEENTQLFTYLQKGV